MVMAGSIAGLTTSHVAPGYMLGRLPAGPCRLPVLRPALPRHHGLPPLEGQAGGEGHLGALHRNPAGVQELILWLR